ncbi:hypothetical protein BUY43_00365 [Staphylococcus devriesei]|uniref:Uncharacterized protein n=4 Tax=Staphylococcus devriesei TaxID=586733 RepID=A0ABX5I243_9STAP|nr:hypothetical protein [Staphylococcus devriesei]MCE5090894.1 hypothetical protein [Staphylococcus devriesei]MCE5097263.1 hypothetical protein [Staphylococcus devriesei]PNZ87986.1 hypothetical protein CD147_06615 [Staphylococcus devriesei]PTF13763.1 hypothetical protein BUY47_07970 [Staphylococcus devriesei]RIL75646.1 hypothetical protein BUY43_00365 [Staphylococcus devriesei]
MKGKYIFIITIMIIFGGYYLLNLDEVLDKWIAHIISSHSWIEFLGASIVISLVTLPFYKYMSQKMIEMKHINALYMKEKDEAGFDMTNFRSQHDIPEGKFIYISLICLIILVGLGLKIAHHFTFDMHIIVVALLYVITTMSAFYYSVKLVKQRRQNNLIMYLILGAISSLITYLLTPEEQMFLLIFSIITYILWKLKLLKN